MYLISFNSAIICQTPIITWQKIRQYTRQENENKKERKKRETWAKLVVIYVSLKQSKKN